MTNRYEIDDTPIATGTDVFFKRPSGKFYVRFYALRENDGKLKVGKRIANHWVEGKRLDCLGKGKCPFCLKEKPQQRTRLGVILRASQGVGTGDKIKIWDAPISVWKPLKDYISENGDSCIGDKGVTFRITYDPKLSAASQYGFTPVPKDQEVLAFEGSEPYFDKQDEDESVESVKSVEVVEVVEVEVANKNPEVERAIASKGEPLFED